MNRRTFLRHCTALGALLVTGACSRPAPAPKPDSNIDHWTCAMHPSVHAPKPGNCPICSMELVPVFKRSAQLDRPAAAAPAVFTVPVERQQQIGVRFAEVARRPLQQSIRAAGLLETDKSRDWQFAARVDGYVQQLFVTSPGELVEKDAPLLAIYSPELFTGERELVQLLRMRDEAQTRDARETPELLIDSARRRLRQWNMTDAQIAALEKSRQPADTLTLLSPFRGVVQTVAAGQGKSVKTGDPLVDVADLSVVWAWVEFYENEISALQTGQSVAVTAQSRPGETWTGTVSLIDPFLSESTRTARVRVSIPNPEFTLRPGMYVTAELAVGMGDALTVPIGAIMPTGARSVVFVDKGGGALEPRAVSLGGKFGDFYEVKEGVSEGERVVAGANFLIDAEAKIQGALKAFESAPQMP